MKKTIFLFVLFLLPLPVDAAKVNLKPQQQKVEDPGSAEALLYKNPKDLPAPAKENSSSGLSIASTCTDSLGMIHKKGETGYEACLRNLNKTQPENKNQPNSLGFTIGK